MTIPGLDTAVYGHINPALLGNESERYFDARDQYAKYLTPNQLDKANKLTSSKPNKLATNQLANAQSNLIGATNHPTGVVNHLTGPVDHLTAGLTNHLTSALANPLTKDRKSSLRSKLKSGDLRRLLKRRYSENVISNLPVTEKMNGNHSPTMPNLSKDANCLLFGILDAFWTESFGCFLDAFGRF